MTNSELTELIAMSRRYADLYSTTGFIAIDKVNGTPQILLTKVCFKELFSIYETEAHGTSYLIHNLYGIRFVALDRN